MGRDASQGPDPGVDRQEQGDDGYYVQVVKLMKSWRDRLPTRVLQAEVLHS